MREMTGMLDGTWTAIQAGGAYDMGGEQAVAVHIVVTAIGGTSPSATFVLEDSADGTNWANVATSAAVTANGTLALRSGTTPAGRYVRVRLSALSGTSPTLTTAVKGRAV